MSKYPVLNPVLHGGVIVSSGYVELDEEQAERLLELEAIGEAEQKELSEMTTPELKEYAKENNIDLGEAAKKPDILKAIQEAEIAKEGE